MRRGTWILAISGVMALNNGVTFADEPGQSELQLRNGRQGIPSAGSGLPSRYSRGAAAEKSSAKNYYDDLFGTEPSKSSEDNDKLPWDTDPPAVAKPKATAAKTAAVPTEGAKPAAADARKFASSPRGLKPAAESTDAKVIQAGYDKQSAAAERKMIQQVRSEGKRSTAPAMPEVDSPEPTTAPASKAAAARGNVVDTGPQTPQITIEWVRKGEFNVGQECQLELHVKNGGITPATQVSIDGLFPNTIRLTSAEPKPAANGDKVTWSFDSIGPGVTHKISVKLIPSRRGELGATANVRFTGTASASFRVEEPMLKVALQGQTEVNLGDPVPQTILVSNPGSGTVNDVKVEARLSEGLEHKTPGERLVIEIGSVSAGETRTVRLPLSAVKGGHQSISVAATSSSDAGATAQAKVNVVAPSLKIAADGPSLRYKGRHAKYTLTVVNDGSVANNNIRINQAVADGFKFVSADRNGKYDPSTRNVHWFIGRLEPGQTAQVVCELNPVALGDFTHAVSVMADSGIRADAKAQTRVDGIVALTMELLDVDDPVEIGAETAYEIHVKNDGSKAATGVSIACELPAAMELKNIKAPVEFVVEGRQVLFKSLEQVAPGSEVIYRIHVKGVQEGNHRLRARMTASSLQEPVLREEATKVYADSK